MSKYEINVPPTMIDPDGTNYVGEFSKSTGGVTSWNDLTDRPFGEMEAPLYTNDVELQANGTGVSGSLGSISFVKGEEYTIKIDGQAYKATCTSPYPGVYMLSSNEKTDNGTSIVDYNNGYFTYTKDEWEKVGSAPETFNAHIEFLGFTTVLIPEKYLPKEEVYELSIKINTDNTVTYQKGNYSDAHTKLYYTNKPVVVKVDGIIVNTLEVGATNIKIYTFYVGPEHVTIQGIYLGNTYSEVTKHDLTIS